MCSTTGRVRLDSAFASIRQRSSWTKIQVRAENEARCGLLRSARGLTIQTNIALSRRKAGTRGDFRNGIVHAFPDANQQNFRSARIAEDVENVGFTINFKEAGATRVRPRRGARIEQQAQFRQLLRCMVSEVFQKGRLFRKCHLYHVLPPH
jgi:hypothetical protein